MKNHEPSLQQMKRLTEISLALGVAKKKGQQQLVPVKLAFHPYSTNKTAYAELEQVSLVWQKLIFKASKNSELIDRVYESIKDTDQMISNLMRIRALTSKKINEGVVFCRYDYFMNLNQEPKIIEYNLFSVSMSAHTENFQKAKSLCDLKNKQKYVKNEPNKCLARGISQLYLRKNLKGIFLMIVSPTQTNVIEQRLLEAQLAEFGIRVARATLYQVPTKLQIDQQGNLRLHNEQVSVVYYRAGYQISDYQQDPKIAWKSRQILEISNAIKVPNVTFDLMNQKRMQVELSKESVYSQYLCSQQIQLLKKSLVPVWQFDHMSEEEFNKLLKTIEQNGKEYVLKPNLEGGGHNIYGEDVKKRLKQMSPQERKKYILMQKIVTKPIENILLSGSQHVKTNCCYEVSQYSIMAIDNSQDLKTNQCCGFLIRAKPENVNEGGIMAGVGCICSWIIQDNQ